MKIEKLQEYITKANVIFNGKYDYSECNPKTCKDKAIIICPIHGKFEMSLDSHVNFKHGCPKCAKNRKKTNEDVIQLIHEKYGDRFDTSKVNYVNNKTKITLICPEHGEFEIRLDHLLNGHNCPKCSVNKKRDVNDYIYDAQQIHKNEDDTPKYKYDGISFKTLNDFIDITCPIHGVFRQRANSHLQGCGCPKCNGGVVSNREEFIEKGKKIHGDSVIYDEVEYVNAKTKVKLICPIHGEFWQTPDSHLRGRGCPKCNHSKLEKNIENLLEDNDIEFITQYSFKELNGKRLDFYLPKYNIAIECQGEQHFIPSKFSNSVSDEDSVKRFQLGLKYDTEKFEICKEKNIKLIYFIEEKNLSLISESTSSFYEDKIMFFKNEDVMNFIKSCEDEKETV